VATRAGRALFELGVESVWSAQPEELSLLHLLFSVHSAGSLRLMFDTEGGAQQDRFVGGSQRLALLLAQQLGDRLLLGTPVRGIRHDDHGVTVSSDAAVAHGRRAVVALAPALAGRIAYDPPLSGDREQLTQRMPLGTVIKCMAIYDEPFWREEGMSGQGLSDAGPVTLTFDNSPPDGSPGVLLGFLEGRRARELGRVPAAQRRAAAIDCFARLFGPRARSPSSYVERLWAEEEWSRGGYVGYLPPGVWTSFGRALRAPCGTLHWAGAEYATVWNGYMDGAVRSGEQAAAQVLDTL
jgi:monoamine oxidase